MSNPTPAKELPFPPAVREFILEVDAANRRAYRANFRLYRAWTFYVSSLLWWVVVIAGCAVTLHLTRSLGPIESAVKARLELKFGLLGQLVICVVMLRWRGWLTIAKIGAIGFGILLVAHLIFGSEIPLP